MKFFAFFILLISIANMQYDDSKILWKKNTKLKWEDFQRILPPKNIEPTILATTYSSINYEYTQEDNSIPEFQIKAYFLKDSSWTRTQSITTLEHEQLHFDITELYARKIRKGIDSLNYLKINDINEYLNVINYFSIELNNVQDKYDNKTHLSDGVISERLEAQAKWIDSIAIELDRLKEYELKQ